MPEYDITYSVVRQVRVTAPDLDHATLQARALVRASRDGKLMSIFIAGYVAPPPVPKQKKQVGRDCTCPLCAGTAEWSDAVLGLQTKNGIDAIPVPPEEPK